MAGWELDFPAQDLTWDDMSQIHQLADLFEMEETRSSGTIRLRISNEQQREVVLDAFTSSDTTSSIQYTQPAGNVTFLGQRVWLPEYRILACGVPVPADMLEQLQRDPLPVTLIFRIDDGGIIQTLGRIGDPV